jgi:uncharacterized RDD family membrane protein YckC
MVMRKRLSLMKRKQVNENFRVCHLDYLSSLKGVPLASFRKRSFAFLIDTVIISILDISVSLEEVISFFRTGSFKSIEAPSEVVEKLIGVMALILYFGLMTYFWNGQTFGKKLMKIRVISLKKEKLTFWQSIERSLGYGASALEAGFGFFQVIWDENRQAVHDRIAETAVVKIK